MTTRDDLLESIANTIADYRREEIPQPTPEHVEKWINQFGVEVQTPLLIEMDYVLKNTYCNKEEIVGFLTRLVINETLAGENYTDFWGNANFLNIQQNGHSQEEMLKVFNKGLQEKCGLIVENCGSEKGPYIYLDDVLFSGFRVGDDLEIWLKEDAPSKAIVHIILIAYYSYGQWKIEKRLKEKAKSIKKDIQFHFWRAISYENNPSRSTESEVLWPAVIPDNELLKTYMAEEQRFPFIPRQSGGTCKNEIFSSEEGRQLLERELLLAGMRIRSFSQSPSSILRPLGFSPFGLGFGALIVTFRNCPNNCPLAFWWGNPKADDSSPLSKWYPLFPRKTYNEENDFSGFKF